MKIRGCWADRRATPRHRPHEYAFPPNDIPVSLALSLLLTTSRDRQAAQRLSEARTAAMSMLATAVISSAAP